MSFLLALGARQCYVVEAYVPPNNMPAMHSVEQELKAAPKGLEIILMGDLNMRLRDPRDEHKEDPETPLADRGLVSMTDHFMPRQRYRRAGSWTWSMQWEGGEGGIRPLHVQVQLYQHRAEGATS